MAPTGSTYKAGAVRLCAALLLGVCSAGGAYAQSAGTEAPAVAAPPAGDAQAEYFLRTCAGCHTVGGGALSGPDLKPSSAWPRQNLFDAIRRMEKNVGPMTDDTVNGLSDFLQSPDAADRLKAEQQRAAMRQAAALEPASKEKGAGLFHGGLPFANGGLACAGCHEAGGAGGNLAIALDDAFARLGEAPLLSTCETPGFPLMRAAYANTGLTKQEALHVVKYLESLAGAPPSRRAISLHGLGAAGAVLVLGGLGTLGRNRLRGVRAGLIRNEMRNRRRIAGGGKEGQ